MVAARGALVIMVLGKVEEVVLDHDSGIVRSVRSLNKVTKLAIFKCIECMRSVGKERKERKKSETEGPTYSWKKIGVI